MTYYPQARAVLNLKIDPLASGGTEPDATVYTLPVSATIHRNSANKPDEFEMTVDRLDAPFDPEMISNGEVSFYVFDSDENDRLFDRSIVRDRTVDTSLRQETQRRLYTSFTANREPSFIGLFTEVRTDDGEEQKMTIQARDYTELFALKQWPPSKGTSPRRVPTGKRLDAQLSALIAEVDPSGSMSLFLSNIKSSELPVIQARGVSGGQRGLEVDSDTNYWDVMQRLASLYGFRLYVSGLLVVLEQSRAVVDDASRAQYRLNWGRNISDISITRSFGREKTPAIIFRGYDPKQRKQIEVVYPPGFKVPRDSTNRFEAAKKKKRLSAVAASRQVTEYRVIETPISDAKALERAAAEIWETTGRNERAITIRTSDLTDSNGANLLDIRAGDALFVGFDPFNAEQMRTLSESERISLMVERGFGGDVAVILAQHYDKLNGLNRPLYVKEATITYDEGAVDIEIALADFVIVGTESDEKVNKTNQRLGAA